MRISKTWIYTGVVGLGFPGVLPAALKAERQNRDREEFVNFADRRDDRRDDRIERDRLDLNHASIPGDVKAAIGREVGRGDVNDVDRVRRGNRTYYRVAYDKGSVSRIIYFDENGKVVREFNDNEEGRQRVNYDDLPGPVKNTIGKHSGAGGIDRVIQVTRSGQTFYVADLVTGDGIDRIYVDSTGKQLTERPALLSDRGDRNDRDRRDDRRFDDEGDFLAYNSLPGEVKNTVGKSLGRDAQVVDVRRSRSGGKEVYRVEIEENNRSRAMYVAEDGKLVRETNTTDEGRQRVNLNDVPGEVKTGLLKAAGNEKFSRIAQVTHGRDTWYVGYLPDGKIVRVDSNGRLISSTDVDNRDTRDRRDDRDARDRRDTRDDRRADWRDSDKRKDKVEFGSLPNDVKEAVRKENRDGGHVKDVWNMEGGYYLVEFDNKREVRVGHDGRILSDPALLSDRKRDERDVRASAAEKREARRGDRKDDRPREKVAFADLPGDVKDTIRKTNQGEGHIGTIWHRGGHYLVQLDSGRYFLVSKEGKLLEPHKDEMGVKDAKKVDFASLNDKAKDAVRDANRANHVEGVWQVDDRHYLVEYQDRTFVYIDKNGNIVD